MDSYININYNAYDNARFLFEFMELRACEKNSILYDGFYIPVPWVFLKGKLEPITQLIWKKWVMTQ